MCVCVVRGPRGDVSHVYTTRARWGPSCRNNGIGDAGAQALAAELSGSALTSLNLGCMRVLSLCVCVCGIAREERGAVTWRLGGVLCGEGTARMSHVCTTRRAWRLLAQVQRHRRGGRVGARGRAS